MGKIESSLKNMVLSLTIISTVFAFLLGGAYELTKEPIEQAKLQDKLSAILMVVPEFTNDPTADMFTAQSPDGYTLEVYPAYSGDKLVGYAVSTLTMNGFSGEIDLMVGFQPDGTIINISVLEHAETPGLGSKMATPEFKDQFMGKNPSSFNLRVKKDGGDVDAITAATISSRAFVDAVNRGYNTLFANGADLFSGATTSPDDVSSGETAATPPPDSVLVAVNRVLPNHTNKPEEDRYFIKSSDGFSLEIYPALVAQDTVGYAVNTLSMNGFNGEINLIVAFAPDGTLIDFAMLHAAETPRFTTKVETPDFKDQFLGKNPATFNLGIKADGGDIDALSGVTVSARAFVDAVNRAYSTLFPYKPNSFTGNTSAPDRSNNRSMH